MQCKGFTPLLILFISNFVSAEPKTFIKEYTYQASEYDSKVSCRALALEQVKRLLLEELGTYLESETEVKNFRLTKDQIKTFTAGIVQTVIVSEKWDTETLKYWLKAIIMADPRDVVDKVNSIRRDLQKTRELEETRKKVEELSVEIERLKLALDKEGLLGLLCINSILFWFFDKGSYDFEHQVFLILNAVCSALDDADLVIQAFHESK